MQWLLLTNITSFSRSDDRLLFGFFFCRFYGRKSRRIQVWRSQYINSKFWETRMYKRSSANRYNSVLEIVKEKGSSWARGKTSVSYNCECDFLTLSVFERLQAGKRLVCVAGVWTEIRLSRLRWTREERGKETLARASCSRLPYNPPFTSFLQACQAYWQTFHVRWKFFCYLFLKGVVAKCKGNRFYVWLCTVFLITYQHESESIERFDNFWSKKV